MSLHRAYVLLSFLLISALSVFAKAAIPSSELVGSTKGSFAVSSSGTATYDIPIKLPPNVGGVQPKLSLSYDSSSGNGLLGMGWQLSGLSAITRCPTSPARGEAIDPVDFDSNDKFCLDGQRLVQTSYGRYRTEIDNFALIEGGQYGFTVTTTSGLTMHFGDTDDSRIMAQGRNDVLTWALSEVEDKFGNNYRVQYQNNGYSDGEYWAKFIFMGNSNTTYSHLSFSYDDRLDTILGHVGGTKFQTTQRLKAINILVNNSEWVRKYEISYKPYEAPLNRSYLDNVTECDGTGACKEAQKFLWEGSVSESLQSSAKPVVHAWGSASFTWPGDFNGDGLTDIASATGGNIYVKLSEGDGFRSENWTVPAQWGSSPWTWTGDFNGDGLTDIASASGTNVYMKLSEGFRFRAETWTVPAHWGNSGYNWAEDFNGDGLTDIASAKNGNIYVKLSTGSGFQAITYSVPATWGSSPWTWAADFNGDGLTDIASASGTNVYMKLNEGNGFRAETWTVPAHWGSSGYNWAQDFNGDGLPDIASAKSGNIFVKYSTGAGFEAKTWNVTSQWNSSPWTWAADFNGDGLTDIASAKNGSLYMKLSEGDKGFRSEVWPVSAQWGSSGYNWVMDTDGDGFAEIGSARYGNVYLKEQINSKHYRIKSFPSSLDQYTDVKYKPLTDSSVYERGSVAGNYPIIPVQNANYVISEVNQPNGIGGNNTSTYTYEGMRFDIKNHRSLGFAKTVTENPQTNTRTTATYSQSYPYIGMQTSVVSEYLSSNYSPLSESTFTLGQIKTDVSNNILFPYVSETTTKKYFYRDDFNSSGNPWSAGFKSTTTSNTYNIDGQITNSTVFVTGDGNGYTTTTNKTFENGYAKRRQGEVRRIEVASRSYTTPELTRTSEFEYDWTKERRTKEIIEPDNSDKNIRRVTTFTYDGYGNRTSSVTCNGDYVHSCTKTTPGARYSATEYDPKGLFVEKTTDAFGNETLTSYSEKFGLLTSKTDINGLTGSSTYDSLGRIKTSTNPIGVTTTINRTWCDIYCPIVEGNQAYYKVTKQAPGSPTSVTYYDQYNRVIRKQTEGFGANELIYVDTEYDSFGRVKRTSEPYFASNDPDIYWNTPSYDFLGRKVKVNTPNQDGGYDDTSQIQYQGYRTIMKDALGRVTQESKNALGKVIQMVDRKYRVTRYEYDSLSNLVKTTDSAGNEVALTYDIRGRKLTMDDPDMGFWEYKYNTFDQPIEQTDAKLQKTTTVYDVLGRMTSRTDGNGTSTWTYHNNSSTAPAKSAGKLKEKKAANGDYTQYTYNSIYGQLISTKQKIGTKTFTVGNGYDSLGRVNSTTYPSTTKYSSGLIVKRSYTSKGFLSKVYKSDNSVTYWQADSMSPRGQLEAATFGNGVQDLNAHSYANGWLIAQQSYKGATDLRDMVYKFDEVGNIKERWDVLQSNMIENFEYDVLDRLTDSNVTGGTSGLNHTTKSYVYDDLGNITSKSDVGSYSYTGCGGRPHAVCSAGGKNYVYDANGSMITTKIGNTVETTIGYTSYNKANYMQKGNYAITFEYDADRNRNYRSRIQNASVNQRTYYVGTNANGAKIFEHVDDDATGKKDIHYIYGSGGQAVATHITEGTSAKTEYFHRDHLGSVSLVTNDAGAKVNDPVSFDAWGKRRNPNWTDNSSGTGLDPITGNVGFTGQETVEEIGLVHMNGRIYDPNLGRFLSADPLIQAPYNSQSYNRYSYVMNNPLGYIDPTGYSWLSKKWKSIKKAARKIDWKEIGRFTLRTVACGAYCAAVYSKPGQKYIKKHKWAQQAMSIAAGVADALGCSGACSAANAAMLTDINGGDFNDVLKSAAMAYASYVAFSSVNAQYGKTWNVSRVIANGVTGGAVSVAYGGKFGDGAAFSLGTAALAYGFNAYTRYAESKGLVLEPTGEGAELGEQPFATTDTQLAVDQTGNIVTMKAKTGVALTNYTDKQVGFGDEFFSAGSEYSIGKGPISPAHTPFLHEISIVHDIMRGDTGSFFNRMGNVPSMIPAAIWVVGGYGHVANPINVMTRGYSKQ